jgi:Sec-independent protein translocase protein TatA
MSQASALAFKRGSAPLIWSTMLSSIGVSELLVILVVTIFVCEPRKFPEFSRSLGRGLAEFKKVANGFGSTLEQEMRLEARLPLAHDRTLHMPITSSPYQLKRFRRQAVPLRIVDGTYKGLS